MTHDEQRAVPALPWWAGGLGIGFVLLIAVALVQPIGVSTQYVVLDGVVLHALFPELAEHSAYLMEAGGAWTLATYEFFFVAGIPLGAFLAAWTTKRFTTRVVPEEWSRRFGASPARRLWWSFVGGFLLLFGARFGGGCTSGHMISGVSQLAVSSILFSAALFASAVLTARWLYGEGGRV
ncbi:YeeE/YedE thiosulfate transporter family protein [Nitrospira moscoviensis]|uniref:YeeE/YedE family protein n=1 Tax=Nitrospira moscoviensis TaxID=42253 RepID=A0A0K2GIA0_NITMO|nr:YeeE/YedE thiosulfate transporter family protein [Nitrospira moscoviensis]ALA60342.1 YeeE/YedE family protein [Nitrospira moscoviensis]